MDEVSRYAVGIDVGTENVRAVVMSVARDGATSVVGYGEARNSGMRKGVVANLVGPGEAIDRMLVEVERMSGHEINSAFLSINGAHVLSTKTEGMIALGPKDHEINQSDLERVEDSATTGRIPANRDVLEVLPMGYILDGQAGIRDPLGMTGSRLEIEANVLSALTPNCNNLRKAAEDVGKVHVEKLIPSVVASARAVLSERQMENGRVLVEVGDWHEGVLGIIAGRLTEEYKRPAFVLSEVDGVMKGSGRSFGDFNLAEALCKCQNCLLAGGGHAGACGLKLLPSEVNNFCKSVNKYYDSLGLSGQEKYLEVAEDLVIEDLAEITVEEIENLAQLEPYGEGNSEPVILLRGMEVMEVRKLGADGQHLKLTISDGHKTVQAMAFYAPEEWLKIQPNQKVSLKAHLEINAWQGMKTAEVRIVSILT